MDTQKHTHYSSSIPFQLFDRGFEDVYEDYIKSNFILLEDENEVSIKYIPNRGEFESNNPGKTIVLCRGQLFYNNKIHHSYYRIKRNKRKNKFTHLRY